MTKNPDKRSSTRSTTCGGRCNDSVPISTRRSGAADRLPGWTVQGQPAHIIGIESVIPRASRARGRAADLPHVRNELGARTRSGWNRSDAAGHDVLERFRAVAEQRLDILRSRPKRVVGTVVDADRTGTVRDLIPFRVLDSFIHELDHAPRPRAAADMQSPSAQLTLGRCAASSE